MDRTDSPGSPADSVVRCAGYRNEVGSLDEPELNWRRRGEPHGIDRHDDDTRPRSGPEAIG